MRATSLSYAVLTSLADHSLQREDRWIELLQRFNLEQEMPEAHDGGKPYSWVVGAMWFDAWAWGATWDSGTGTLNLRPNARLLGDPRAPKTAVVATPRGKVELHYENREIRTSGAIDFPVAVLERYE